jgi:hypothetical protein
VGFTTSERASIGGVAAVAAIALAVAAIAARASSTPARVEPDCRLAQEWSEGDQHFWETLDLRADASGEWIQSGFDSDAPQSRLAFTWTATATALTATLADGTTATFEIEPRGTYCSLVFETHPFEPPSSRSWRLTDGPPY